MEEERPAQFPETAKGSAAAANQLRQMIERIDRLYPLAQLKMQLGGGHPPGIAEAGNRLAPPDSITAFHQQHVIVGISAHPTAGMLDQQQISEALEGIAGIGNSAVFGGADNRPQGCGNIDPVIMSPARGRAENRDHTPADGPIEQRCGRRIMGGDQRRDPGLARVGQGLFRR